MLFGDSVEVPAHFLDTAKRLEFSQIPHFGAGNKNQANEEYIATSVRGNASYLVLKRANSGSNQLSLKDAVLPIRVLGEIGVESIIIIDTCTSLNPTCSSPGDLCLLVDHINFLGSSPLIGANASRWGPRFPDMTEPYDPALRSMVMEKANLSGITLHESVFAGVCTAELTVEQAQFLRQLGADITGPGFVSDVLAARHMGLRVLALSIVVKEPGNVASVSSSLLALIDAIAPFV